MTVEFELPCTACEGELQEARLPAKDLCASIAHTNTVTIAVCSSCGERHYPEQALINLSREQS